MSNPAVATRRGAAERNTLDSTAQKNSNWYTRRARITSVIALVLIGALTAFMSVPDRPTQPFSASEFRYGQDYRKDLVGIPVVAQETPYTCNVASMVIVSSYLGLRTTEHELRSDLDLLTRQRGMLPGDYLYYVNKALAPLATSVSLINPTTQTEILNVVAESLDENLPVVMLYSAPDDWNRPHWNTHYAVIYGIDMAQQIVKISNPYGYLEDLSFDDFFAGLDFTDYRNEPLSFRLALQTGWVRRNNLFVFSR